MKRISHLFSLCPDCFLYQVPKVPEVPQLSSTDEKPDTSKEKNDLGTLKKNILFDGTNDLDGIRHPVKGLDSVPGISDWKFLYGGEVRTTNLPYLQPVFSGDEKNIGVTNPIEGEDYGDTTRERLSNSLLDLARTPGDVKALLWELSRGLRQLKSPEGSFLFIGANGEYKKDHHVLTSDFFLHMNPSFRAGGFQGVVENMFMASANFDYEYSLLSTDKTSINAYANVYGMIGVGDFGLVSDQYLSSEPGHETAYYRNQESWGNSKVAGAGGGEVGMRMSWSPFGNKWSVKGGIAHDLFAASHAIWAYEQSSDQNKEDLGHALDDSAERGRERMSIPALTSAMPGEIGIFFGDPEKDVISFGANTVINLSEIWDHPEYSQPVKEIMLQAGYRVSDNLFFDLQGTAGTMMGRDFGKHGALDLGAEYAFYNSEGKQYLILTGGINLLTAPLKTQGMASSCPALPVPGREFQGTSVGARFGVKGSISNIFSK